MTTVITTKEELTDIIEKAIDYRLAKFNNQPKKPEKNFELLKREDIANMFNVNINTVTQWSKAGVLKPHYLGRRVFFYKSEVLEALESQKILKRKKGHL